MVSIQRELAPNMVVTRELCRHARPQHAGRSQQTNPGDPALCLSVSQPSQVAPGSATCGPFAENGVFTTRGRHGDQRHAHRRSGRTTAAVTDAGDDRILALQRARAEPALHAGRRRASWPATRYSKSVDVSSNLGEQVNPFDVALSEAPSAFDMRHNFVVSYNYELPFERLFNARANGRPGGRCRARRGSAADFR